MTIPRDSDGGRTSQAEQVGSAVADADLTSVTTEEGPEGLRVIVVGEVDLTSHPLLDRVSATVAEHAPCDVTVDLSQATFIDSSMLGFLAKLHTRVKESGHQLVLYAPQRTVLRALTVVGFDRVMTIVQP
jgi:anti-sigma B factor antagonist